MNDLLPLLSVLLPGVCVILLTVLLLRQGRALRDQEQARLRQEHGLESLGNALLDELDAEYDQTVQSLYQANQSLMTTLSQMGQNQGALLESMQRQVLLSTRNQEENTGRLTAGLNDSLTRLDGQMEQLREATARSLNSMRLENERQLSEMRKTVDEKLTENLDRKLNESFAQVSDRLESVYKGLGEMHSLAAGVGDLRKVLTNVKTRGIWGEMQLGSLIRQSLAPGQYAENVAVVPGSAERVEFAIRLPNQSGETVWLAVDSKFPQESYLRLVEASQRADAAGTEAARRELQRRIRDEAKKIREKYISPPSTADFALMFLPVEGLYAEVLQTPELVEAIQREQRVVIAGPGTFSAMLNALQMGFRSLAIQRRSGEVFRLLDEIKTDFGRFSDLLEDTRRRLNQAGESIDTAVSRTRTIQRRLSHVELNDPSPLPEEAVLSFAGNAASCAKDAGLAPEAADPS